MGAGGAAGAIIAARMRRIQETVDAFRLGDATSADRARRLEDLGLMLDRETKDLMADRVILPGTAEGTFYLSEAGYIYRRDDSRVRKSVIVVAVIVLVVGVTVAMLIGRP